MKKILCFLLIVVMVMGLFVGCDKAAQDEKKSAATQGQTTQEAAKSDAQKSDPITLRHLTWSVPDVADAFDVIKKKYEEENKNVTIEIENVPTDQYANALKTKLFAGDAPDIIQLHPVQAEYIDTAKNGYIEDITSDPMMQNVLPGTLNNIKIDGKIYGVPYDQVSLVVLYNRKIFADNGLKIPANYQEMLTLCETLKSKGITPVAHGIKDWYVVQFLPYQIAPTLVYAKNTAWDKDLAAGKAKFNSPEWEKVFEMYLEFEKKGYFTKNALGVGDQQSVQMFATGKAAMTFQGMWSTTTAKQANPELDIGAFPFPANQPGEELWMSASLGHLQSLSKSSKNLAEAKKYLSVWTRTDVAQLWADRRPSVVSTIKGVKSNDKVMAELEPYLQKLNSWQFCNNGWPAGVEEVMSKKFQELYAAPDKVTVNDLLNEMDKKVQEKTKK